MRASRAQKRGAEAKQRKLHQHETGFEAIQTCRPSDRSRYQRPQSCRPATQPAKSPSFDLNLLIHK
ncbi:MAG: hypothetical protein DMF03_04555 [Verrucomicrobia bacterium]|nr:MAG: hypothetical protein DMF03_04555 [Verrucomicrobiota bacterium]